MSSISTLRKMRRAAGTRKAEQNGGFAEEKMSCYSKVAPRIWNDEKFSNLSHTAQLVLFFILTNPNQTMLGAMRATIPGMAAEMKMEPNRFALAFREVLSKGLAEHDEKWSFVSLPNFLKYNEPQSLNVVRAWPKAFESSSTRPLTEEFDGYLEEVYDEKPVAGSDPYRQLRDAFYAGALVE